MKIVLILPPLGLLALGGSLLDAGHEVKLVDGEFGPMSVQEILEEARSFRPDAVLVGNSGSTSAHPSAVRIMRAFRDGFPSVWIDCRWRDVAD
jgi:anaerobic magnesium-protoporphyrin IX monomethyl ester cyclase